MAIPSRIRCVKSNLLVPCCGVDELAIVRAGGKQPYHDALKLYEPAHLQSAKTADRRRKLQAPIKIHSMHRIALHPGISPRRKQCIRDVDPSIDL